MKALTAALLLAPALAFGKADNVAVAKAEPIALSFNAVPLVAFGEGTFKAILKRDFVVSPEVLGLDRRITINVKSIDVADVARFVDELLAHEGIQTMLRNGIYYLTLRREYGQSESQGDSVASLAPAQQLGACFERQGAADSLQRH
ncbi:hypothetical protein [Rugamonas sp. DEMB1]|uniref:hypothetical protein n=1 Tax=Rugamonas sp. DEMB1 TaxID=3039386 RepID=UPI00244BA0AB|nr:hypothetical protein [Rugamonas sp. DEMB1]WGG50320.1 hypothetical protein QC826_28530 [Rugamonas sp. DEMB1]